MKNGDKPAYPTDEFIYDKWTDNNQKERKQDGGLTKREYFAGLAMQGLLANHEFVDRGIRVVTEKGIPLEKHIAGCSCEFADALLAELEKEGETK